MPDLLKYYTEIQNVFKEFEVQETMPTTQQLKDAFNLRMKDTSEDQEDVKISFWEVFDEFVRNVAIRITGLNPHTKNCSRKKFT